MTLYFGFDGEPITSDEWMRLFESESRIVAQDRVDDYLLSTVWLGMDHGRGRSEQPLIFETMLFYGDSSADLACWRYSTWAEAEAGHAAHLEELRLIEAASLPRS